MTFAVGSRVTVREVLHGQVWLEFPETVVADDGADDGDVLATLQVDGTPMTHHPEHPFGPHPWSGSAQWSGPSVLKLRRPGEWYSVWRFFDGGVPRYWYVNFETPLVRTPDAIEVNDLELDLVVHPDGRREWKDVQDLAPHLASGRIAADELGHVLAAATEVWGLLDRDERWWAGWDDWVPAEDLQDRRRPRPGWS